MITSYKEHLIKNLKPEILNKIRFNLELGLDTYELQIYLIFESHVRLMEVNKKSFKAGCGCNCDIEKITWEEYDDVQETSINKS